MDGLVSTGNKFPDTILKIILAIQKIFGKNFIHILIIAVDKRCLLVMIKQHETGCIVYTLYHFVLLLLYLQFNETLAQPAFH